MDSSFSTPYRTAGRNARGRSRSVPRTFPPDCDSDSHPFHIINHNRRACNAPADIKKTRRWRAALPAAGINVIKPSFAFIKKSAQCTAFPFGASIVSLSRKKRTGRMARKQSPWKDNCRGKAALPNWQSRSLRGCRPRRKDLSDRLQRPPLLSRGEAFHVLIPGRRNRIDNGGNVHMYFFKNF